MRRSALAAPAAVLAVACLAAALRAQPAPAGLLRGAVVNGTTQRPVAGVQVALFTQGALEGSVPVRTVATDAAGHFQMPAAPGGAQVLRTTYRGVQYWQPVTAAGKPLQVTVYDLAPPTSQFQVKAQVAVVQPENGELAVVDEYVVENHLHRTLYRRGGLFRFRVPRNIQPDGARVIGPSGVGLNRDVQPAPRYAGEYTLDYPLVPGETRIQVSYRLPYATQQAEITEQAVYPTPETMVYVPEPMKFQGAKFVPVSTAQGYHVYGALATLQPLQFTVSGAAPLPAQLGASASDPSATAGAAGNGGAGEAAADAAAAPATSAMAGIVPPKTWMENNRMGVLIVLVILAITGFAYLVSRRRTVPAPAGAGWAPPVAPPPAAPGAAAPITGAAQPAPAPGLAADLARLKDELFLLEVRRQTGDVDEAAYAQARTALEARLRALRLR